MRHLRVAGITGTSIMLSLQDADDDQLGESPVLNLKEGAGLEIGHPSTLVRSIETVVWEYSGMSAQGTAQFATVADGIRVVLS